MNIKETINSYLWSNFKYATFRQGAVIYKSNTQSNLFVGVSRFCISRLQKLLYYSCKNSYSKDVHFSLRYVPNRYSILSIRWRKYSFSKNRIDLIKYWISATWNNGWLTEWKKLQTMLLHLMKEHFIHHSLQTLLTQSITFLTS